MGTIVIPIALFATLALPATARSTLILSFNASGTAGGAASTSIDNSFPSPIGIANLNFTAIAPISLTLAGDSTNSISGYNIFERTPRSSGILNSTGMNWTGFVIELVNASVDAKITGFGFPGPAVFSTSTGLGTNRLTLSGGNLPNGGLLNLDFFVQSSTNGPEVFTIRETPLTAVPEPASLVLMGVGVLVVGLVGVICPRYST